MGVSPLADVTIPGYPGHTEGPNGQIIRVVMHATVSACVRGGAQAVAAYFQSPSSGGLGHYVVDPVEIVNCADEDLATWGAPPNQGEIHVELCDPQGRTDIQANAADPARWDDADHQAMLALGAKLVADICTRQGVPTVYLDEPAVASSQRGVTGHAEISAAFHQTDHQDPEVAGPFPWGQFMRLVAGPPPPIGPPQSYTVEVDVQLTKVMITVQLDGNGHGWALLDGHDAAHPPVLFPNLTGVFANGADPRVAGYVPLLPPTANGVEGWTQIEAFGRANGSVDVWAVHAS